MGGDVCVLNGSVLDPRRDQLTDKLRRLRAEQAARNRGLPDARKGLAQALLDEMTG
jgi:hypothetical protein